MPYLDAYLCRDGHRLASVIERYPTVQCIACGHVHRFMALRFAGTLLCTAPSTATAIALRLDPQAEPASYIEPPGLLLHRWTADTGLVTHLVPIGSFPGPATDRLMRNHGPERPQRPWPWRRDAGRGG